MANPEHVAILLQGVEAWNRYRRQHPSKGVIHLGEESGEPELRCADLRGADLMGANLEAADLMGAVLSRANMAFANLFGANLHWAHRIPDRTESLLDFSDAILSNTYVREGDLSAASLIADNGAVIVDLRDADLTSANLAAASLDGADLSGANLSRTDLTAASLRGANLSRARMTETNLAGTHLRGANLSNVTLGRTVFMDNDLRDVIGLQTVTHNAPSGIGIDTVYRSGGNIPDVFLRGAGVPESFITYIRSLTLSPIEFYSCFISYSARDQAFAERLHADLRSRNLRCWFAPEDLKIGDRFQESIEESIWVFDKLVIILSTASMQSRWVEGEVGAGREREDRESRTVLFPIRIDDAVMDASQPWAADIRRSRHIGDFRQWQEPPHYLNAFDRLLRDLRTDNSINFGERKPPQTGRRKQS